ncbi:MAG: MBL fold metallo-hydrolase [Actinomycetia bacterium]|nr:MBL fold metallo-hydrolase [Actinomycetes bacterium]
MASRELIVLGTAAQSPTAERGQSSYALRWDERFYVFDPGENTQRQMMKAGLPITHISRVFISHFHGDHCLGLPGLVQRWRLFGGGGRLALHYPSWGRENVDRLLHGSAIDFDLGIEHRPVEPGETQHHDGLAITALELDHTIPTVGWRLEEQPQRHLLPRQLGRLGIEGEAAGRLKRDGAIQHHGRTVEIDEVSEIRPGPAFAFVMDTRVCDNATQLARGADLLLAEATYLDEHAGLAAAHGHLTAVQAARIAVEAGVRRLVLSHFSERYDDVEPFRSEAAALLADVTVARDFDIVSFPPRGVA